MAKIDEITELLVAEISEFEQAVKRLETVQRAKIGIDITELKEELTQHQLEIQKDLACQRQEMNSLGYKLEKAKAYPIWVLIIFGLSIVLNGILIYVLFS